MQARICGVILSLFAFSAHAHEVPGSADYGGPSVWHYDAWCCDSEDCRPAWGIGTNGKEYRHLKRLSGFMWEYTSPATGYKYTFELQDPELEINGGRWTTSKDLRFHVCELEGMYGLLPDHMRNGEDKNFMRVRCVYVPSST